MKDLRILQAGLPKSGNLWLYETIQNALKLAGYDIKSFAKDYRIRMKHTGLELDSPLFAHDVIDIKNDHIDLCHSRTSRTPIDDLPAYITNCTHVWTHSQVTPLSQSVFDQFDKVVYILRDPRDAAVSLSHFPHKADGKHDTQSTSPEDFLHERFQPNIHAWLRHTIKHIELAQHINIHFIFYERLLHDFDHELRALLHFLEIELAPADIANLTTQVSFDEMKKNRPNHVRQGTNYKWINTLDPVYQQQALKLAAPLLAAMHYPLDPSQADTLPQLPDQLTPQIKNLLRPKSPSPLTKLKQSFFKMISR